MALTIVLALLVLIFILITVLPFVRSDFWTFRILEYPRLQKLALGLSILIAVVATRTQTEDYFWWLLLPAIACLVYLLIKIVPYTTFYPKEMKRVRNGDKDKQIKVFTGNVLQDNNEYGKLLKQIKEKDPDVIFLVETDKNWENGMKELEKEYSFSLKAPLDNTYGLLFYTRLKVQEAQINYIVDKEIPSVEAILLLPDGQPFKVFGLHPKPPVPEESLYSTAKDKELMKVAFKVKELDLPCIVMGDLNDVAWSYVTELFRKVSGLLDPRRGRGFYSTFSANHWWMRFPLDYIFCSSHFGLVKMRKLPHNGSDHFSMFIHLQYHPVLKHTQEEPTADAEETKEAAERAGAAVPHED